jgi:hypothetical protein
MTVAPNKRVLLTIFSNIPWLLFSNLKRAGPNLNYNQAHTKQATPDHQSINIQQHNLVQNSKISHSISKKLQFQNRQQLTISPVSNHFTKRNDRTISSANQRRTSYSLRNHKAKFADSLCQRAKVGREHPRTKEHLGICHCRSINRLAERCASRRDPRQVI